MAVGRASEPAAIGSRIDWHWATRVGNSRSDRANSASAVAAAQVVSLSNRVGTVATGVQLLEPSAQPRIAIT